MDFGDILNEWDKIKGERKDFPSSAQKAPATEALEEWLDAKGVGDKDADVLDDADRRAESSRLAALRPQAFIDLHGMTAEEAESALWRFVDASARSGLEKVLVIHGKGLHSEGGVPVLKKTARKVLEAHPLAGRFGEAAKADGGSGALWVMIRKRH
jgi:DNA-nicking Smr family endonuclease